MTKFQLGYRPELDGFRGIAILVVMLYHLEGLPLATGGHIGVDLFFVLSGFLITSLLLSEWEAHNRVDLKAFYIRRALRLLPALYVMVAVLLVFTLAFDGSPIIGDDSSDLRAIPSGAFAALTYSSNWLLALQVNYLGPLIHTWTLAMEEQFYVAWPLLLIILLRMRISLRAIGIGLAIGVVAVGCWRFILWQEVDAFRAQYGPDARADALLIGCLVAVLAYDGRLERLRRRLGTIAPACGLFLLIVIGFTVEVRSAALFLGVASLIDISAAVCLIYLLTTESRRFHRALSMKPLVAIGKVSYGLYLWHLPVFFLLDASSSAGWIAEFLLSFLLAGASYVLVERPALQLKSRFRTSTVKAAQQVRLAS